MDRLDRIVASILLVFLIVSTIVGAIATTWVFTTPSTYYIVTNANDTWFEISEYRTEGWNSWLVHVYAYPRQPAITHPWEVTG
jgi:hypothetical protein